MHINFQLICRNCQKSRSSVTISGDERQIFSMVQRLSPQSFIESTRDKTEEVRNISLILKKAISHIIGRGARRRKDYSRRDRN